MTPEQIKHIREWLDGVPKQVNGMPMPKAESAPHLPMEFTNTSFTITTVKPKVRVSVARMHAEMGRPFTRTTTSESNNYEALRTVWADDSGFIGWLIDDQEVDAPTT